MEIAFNELTNTIQQARAYLTGDENEHHSGIMRNYIQDIVEDIAFLERHRANYGTTEQEAQELVVEARRLKRDIEKKAYILEVAAKRQEKQQPAPNQNSRSSSVKLPRIKLPTFDGETSEDYRGFMDAFQDSLTVEPDLSNVKKWLLLRSQLTGKAFTLIKELPTAPETYEVAVQILEDAYGSVKRAVLKLYERVQNLPCATMDTENLRATYAQLEGVLLSLTHLGEDLNNNYFLRAVILGKYPAELIHLLRVNDEMTLQAFRKEMGAYVKQRDCIIQASSTTTRPEAANNGSKGGAGGAQSKKPRHTTNAISTNGGGTGTPAPPPQVTTSNKNNSTSKKREPTTPCLFCTGTHWADECDKVTALDERLKLVADRCLRCLRSKHVDDTCKSRRVCYYCRESAHHSSLCPKQFSKVLLARTESTPSRFVTAVLPVGNVAKTKQLEARAIFDTAGGRSLITEELANLLELGESGGLRIKFVGVNGAPLGAEPTTARRLLLFPPRSAPVEVDVFVVPKIVDDVEATEVAEIRKQYPKYVALPMPREGNGEKVGLLLGYRCLTSIVTFHTSIFLSPTLQLLSTKFGWVPFGGLPNENEERLDSSIIGLLKEKDPVKLMSELELVGLADFLNTKNEEEALAFDKFHKTIRYIDKRYEVQWPYRTDDPQLENNFGLAFGRLNSLLKQLRKTPDLLAAYDRLIKTQIEEGIVEPVNLKASTHNDLVHYLPHRAVIRLNKSTPVRMVFDAAARLTKSSKSLNDLIHKGGNWVNDIPGVLMRFRCYGIAVTTDIVKAFHQISIASKDRDVVRFLWLRDLTQPPSNKNLCVYRFKRMAFGVVASPFLLTATIKHHLRSFPCEYGNIIERDLYADNLITSLPKLTDGRNFYRIVKDSFLEMSMQLSQWTTDDPQLGEFLTRTESERNSQQSVLGLSWDTKQRTLGIRPPKLPEKDGPTPTKRTVLKEMAMVYDPLGWVAPVVLKAKLFLREIWNQKYDWEKPLPTNLAEEWNTLRKQLNQVKQTTLPRPYGFNGLENAHQIELHAFCDASALAYGVVIYLCAYEETRVWSGIVAAKSRLAPKSGLSIPRLELLAAVTASKYLSYVEQSLQLEKITTKYLWSDAKCVIAWTSSKKVLPAFVERAVKTIHSVGAKEFRYVPSQKNPADVISRGATMDELSNIGWWNGPNWLCNKNEWPPFHPADQEETTINQLENELKEEDAKILFFQSTLRLKKQVNPLLNTNSPFDINPSQYRTTSKLYRVTALCVRAAACFLRGRGQTKKSEQPDYVDARHRWLRWDQHRIYEKSETKGTNVSYLKNLKASLDENNLIRCDTRIKKANLARNQTQPILLVKKSALTKLIVNTTHENNLHSGTAHTLAALRKQYWLPHGRREVYQILKDCHTCSRDVARPYRNPDIADLPEFRINQTETPFQNVGVDLFGPYKVRVGGHRDSPTEKKWVIIFTCLIVRAIHLEVLDDMSAEQFLLSFRRFIGRRGVPKLIVSDNAPQFYVVERIFQCVWRRFATADITHKYYAQHEIAWKFVTPEAPWRGGAYERLIKEIKRTFDKVYRNSVLYERQFELALIEIEGVINSRPITYVDKELESEVITPNDFLRVKYPAIPINFDQPISSSAILDTWKKTQEYIQQFWRIWSDTYLQELRERRDRILGVQNEEDRPPLVGELVLMIDPLYKRSTWRIAVVERLITSEDGKIRSAQIRTAERSRMIRPISKLASLKLLMDLPANVPELTDHNRALVVDTEGGNIIL